MILSQLKRFALALMFVTSLYTLAPGLASAAEIPGNISPLVRQQDCQKLDPVNPDKKINLTIVLKPGTDNTQQVASGRYHPFVLPSQEYVSSLTKWLNDNGITIANNLNNGLILQCSANASTVEKTLGLTINNYTYQGQSFYANDKSPTLPSNLADGINGIFGLDNIRVVKSMLRQAKINLPIQTDSQNLHPLTIPRKLANSAPYTPAEIQKAYGFDKLYAQGINGAGVTAAVVTFASFNQSDIDKFFSDLGISYSGGIEVIQVDGGSGRVNFSDGSSVETSMDIENLLSSAPAAHLLVYESNNYGAADGLIDAFSQLVSDNRAKVVSFSWGIDDSSLDQSYYKSMNTILAAGAAKGITFVGASGDDGGNVPSYPSEDPHFISVGGTSLTLNKADGSVSNEIGWSGSGGGPSNIIPLPSWQTGVNMSSSRTRMSPDVSLNADPSTGYALYYNGSWNYARGGAAGGTSAAAPEVAAAIVLVDQALAQQQKPMLGDANEQLYKLAQSGKNDFRAILSGSNGPYQASSNYNMVTGLGVPQVYNLVMDLAGLNAVTNTTTVGTPTSTQTESLPTVNSPTGTTTSSTPTGDSPTTKTQDFITGIYQKALNRGPNQSELQNWTNSLANGSHTAADLVTNLLLTSPEVSFQSDKQFVDTCAQTILGRNINASDEAFWVGELAKGWSKRSVVVRMINAPTLEFAKECQQYGVKLGTISLSNTDVPVASVTAANGIIAVKMNRMPKLVPNIRDFKVTQSINGAMPTIVRPSAIGSNGNVIYLAVPRISNSNRNKRVVISVTYGDSPTVSAAPFIQGVTYFRY